MCTLTIVREQDRVLVTMNRDDAATRPEAPPNFWPNAEPSFVAPKDLLAGGTWIGVNARSIVACLLNRYDSAPNGRTSRGSIVTEAMRAASVEGACHMLTALDHSAYSPFTCVVVGHGATARLDWTGAELTLSDLPAVRNAIMLTSSSWRFDEVKARRNALFEATWANERDTTDRLAAFHCRRESRRDAWAPMMRRPHSCTKSITQVELRSHDAEMRYWTRETAIQNKLTSPDCAARIHP